MRSGTYGKGNTKFEKLTVKRFPLTLWDSVVYGQAGCGATALGLITGENPLEIAKRNKSKHYSDRFMVNSLRRFGVSVFEINKANLSNKKEWRYSLSGNHVILFSSLIQKAESSWLILWDDVLWHNFIPVKASYQHFLNCPTDTAFLLYRKSWAK